MKLWQRRLEMLKATTAPRLHPSFRCCRLRLNQPNYTRIYKLRHRSDATRSMTLLTLFHPGISPPTGVEIHSWTICKDTNEALACSHAPSWGGQKTTRLREKRVNLWQEETYPSVTQTQSAHATVIHKRDGKIAHKVMGSSRCSIVSRRL